jgi:hypothetical protein
VLGLGLLSREIKGAIGWKMLSLNIIKVKLREYSSRVEGHTLHHVGRPPQQNRVEGHSLHHVGRPPLAEQKQNKCTSTGKKEEGEVVSQQYKSNCQCAS